MSKTKEALTLVDFLKKKRRADCVVCQLPQEVLDQLQVAKKKKITRVEQLAWLNEELGYEVEYDHMEVHYKGQHDR